MIATPVIGFDIDARRNRPSFGIGFFASMSIMPARLEVRDAPLARHQRDGAGDVVRIDVALDGFTDAFQSLGGQTDLLRFPGRVSIPATSGSPMSATIAMTPQNTHPQTTSLPVSCARRAHIGARRATPTLSPLEPSSRRRDYGSA